MDNEQKLILELKHGNENSFTLLFQKYYKDLVLFAGIYISDKSVCEDIVQGVFLNLWSKRATIEIKTSLKSFLLKSVSNKCLDMLRHTKVTRKYEIFSNLFGSDSNNSTEHYILHSDLNSHLRKALAELPEKYKETFELSRLHGVKYKDIAKQQEISERTVEERISKTLKFLRQHLKDFLTCLLFF